MSEWSFARHIYDMNRSNFGMPKPPTLWPSNAAALDLNGKNVGKCRRQMFFNFIESFYSTYPERLVDQNIIDLLIELKRTHIPFTRYKKFVFKMGELFEQMCIEEAKEKGIFISTQAPIFIPELKISGKIDLIVINPTSGKYSIVECKSIYGQGADRAIGKQYMRSIRMGTPSMPNVLQAALYHYAIAMNNSDFEYTRLFYGARDVGRQGEYYIDIRLENSAHYIYYRQIDPFDGDWINTNLTIESIFEQYSYILQCHKTNTIPPKDFELEYSFEKINDLFNQGLLSNTDAKQHQKVLDRIAENHLLTLQGKETKKEITPLVKGDFQCIHCERRIYCYADKLVLSEELGE